ncbi:hypothetical protein F909_01933 [Acinetobacter sp. ANC 3929]|uniref:hypothetical protein n=1 Tax=unclassified Acinetobacter TaxID=196816 RepID=UPI0002CF056F|nr:MULTISPECIES: hypothetical protein [unclassified Acinetobacter]ENW80647.1 hypothetical protein F909_01933 [Acinetobacter sp. ANC 3929]MCH7352074.1 hypothetical protein [Acinetobacter sp. NIPH 2023]MCH7354127.1 hypothetical protein [Acinetobacter sp. NIPH 1958]MCH7358884.1 hypothetical protein [Acinetobacter sp. NIPH 2024]
MPNKLLISTICSGAFLLTACGGGGNNNQTSFDSKEKLDYTKKENIGLINEPVVAISNEHDNPVIDIITIAQELHYLISNQDSSSYTASCQSGSTTLNKDGSVTLNNCKNLTIYSNTGSHSVFGQDEVVIASGTIQAKLTRTTTLKKTDLTLVNFSIDLADETALVNGKLSSTSTSINSDNYQDLFEANQFTYKHLDKLDKTNNLQYILNNYSLASNNSISKGNIDSKAKGELTGEVKAKAFSVNFNSNFAFNNAKDLENMKPSQAKLNIEDINNKQNSIVITQTINGQALINAYANNHTVTGFPQTIDWIKFY